MKTAIFTALLVLGSAAPLIGHAYNDVDADRSHPKAFVKDSAITMKVKSKLAADHLTSAARIHVDTDADGIVWLTGTAHSQAEIDRAISLARETEHVVAVKSDLKIKKDES